ncbi:hypothetical protein R6L23_22810 [Streptomyces sp. SR27]|nr:hypothetical protein [Streptomyces sp. SR27]MDV9191004.1 hypothetical protein [Streptomyces sp. SR27]
MMTTPALGSKMHPAVRVTIYLLLSFCGGILFKAGQAVWDWVLLL